MATLMSFILDTLRPRLDDSTNKKLWLPKLLTDATDNDNPLLPLKADKVDAGKLTGTEAQTLAETLAGDWGLINNYGIGIPDPSNPDPYLSMNSIQLDGLQNITVTSSASTPNQNGYSATLHFALGQYSTGLLSGVSMTPVKLIGGYQVSQAVCTSDDSLTCNGQHSATMIGTGNFTATFSLLNVDADLSIVVNGSGEHRTAAITLTKLFIEGISENENPPGVTISDVTLDQDIPLKQHFIDNFVAALNSKEGQQALLTTINSILQSPTTLAGMEQNINKEAEQLLDDVFGVVPSGGLPADADKQKAETPVDLLLFDRMRVGLQNSAADIYAPLLVALNDNPSLEPWTKDQISVPDQVIGGLKYTNISLTKVVATSISNIVFPIANTILHSPDIQTLMQFGTLPEGPQRNVNRGDKTVTMAVPNAPPLTFQCGFSFQQGKLPFNGNLSLAVTGLSGSIAIALSGADVDSFTLTLQSITLDASHITATAKVTTDPDDKLTDAVLKAVFESSQFLTALAQSVTTSLTGQIDTLSRELTQIARRAITDQLEN